MITYQSIIHVPSFPQNLLAFRHGVYHRCWSRELPKRWFLESGALTAGMAARCYRAIACRCCPFLNHDSTPVSVCVEMMFSHGNEYGSMDGWRGRSIIFDLQHLKRYLSSLSNGVQRAMIVGLLRDWGWHMSGGTAELDPGDIEFLRVSFEDTLIKSSKRYPVGAPVLYTCLWTCSMMLKYAFCPISLTVLHVRQHLKTQYVRTVLFKHIGT